MGRCRVDGAGLSLWDLGKGPCPLPRLPSLVCTAEMPTWVPGPRRGGGEGGEAVLGSFLSICSFFFDGLCPRRRGYGFCSS